MVLEKTTLGKRYAIESSPSSSSSSVVGSRADQLFQSPQGDTESLNSELLRPASSDGSPDAKRARMVNSWTASGAVTVAKRLEEVRATLHEQDQEEVAQQTIKSVVPEFKVRKELSTSQKNTVRLILQYLKGLGLQETVDSLADETGLNLEHALGERVRKAAVREKWDVVLKILEKAWELNIIPREREHIIREELTIQRILSALNKNDPVSALHLIRRQMKCRTISMEHHQEVQELTKLLFKSPNDMFVDPVMQQYRFYCEQKRTLGFLERNLPADFMYPDGHLQKLLRKAHDAEATSCPVHVFGTPCHSIEKKLDVPYYDNCVKDKTVWACNSQVLTAHKGEVTCMAFSPDGKYLAAACSHRSVTIYKFDQQQKTFEVAKRLYYDAYEDHPVKHVSWCHDNRHIAIVVEPKERGYYGVPEYTGSFGRRIQTLQPIIFDIVTESSKNLFVNMSYSSSNVLHTCCTWVGETNDIALADEFGHFEVRGNVLPMNNQKPEEVKANWTGFRMSQLASTRNGGILGLDKHNRIRLYQYLGGRTTDCTLIQESIQVISFALHKSEQVVAVQTELNLHLWDLTRQSLLRTFPTERCKYNFIECSFGGIEQRMVATGSPSGIVYIYDVHNNFMHYQLPSHNGVVNTVVWHPEETGLLVSAGADRLIRVWTHNQTERHTPPMLEMQPVDDEPASIRQKKIMYEHRWNEEARRKDSGEKSQNVVDSDPDTETSDLVDNFSSFGIDFKDRSPSKRKRLKKQKSRNSQKSTDNPSPVDTMIDQAEPAVVELEPML